YVGLTRGELRAVKLKSSLSEFKDLDDFSSCLNQNFKVLKNVESEKLLFFTEEDRNTPLLPDVIITSLSTTASRPLVVRYPLSDANTYGEWKFKDVFQYVLKQDHTSLDTVPRFNPNELPAIYPPINDQELDLFNKKLEEKYYTFRNEIKNEATSRKRDKPSTIFGIVTTGR
ncbi:18022_t:CDS:2, partial [Racocetra fulgida]